MVTILSKQLSSVRPPIYFGAAFLASSVYFLANRSTTQQDFGTNIIEEEEQLTEHISIDFCDKLANKSYLHFSSDHIGTQRPPGIPTSLRILAIDLPETRRAFTGGTCHQAANFVYPDGIAPNKRIDINLLSSDHAEKKRKEKPTEEVHLQIEQKAWVKSMYQCANINTKKVTVQLMEADMIALNPLNLRKTRHIGKIHYDPGRYEDERRRKTIHKQHRDEQHSPLTPQDEMEAPWHQHAWLEEMKLRISGRVPFGAPMIPSGRWNRLLYGNAYQPTVSNATSWSDRLAFWRPSNPLGIDGESHGDNWASNKPHAVVANGSTLQRVPNALRELQQACREHNVPLYVIRDPRTWGGNTHDDLSQVIRDMRSTIKKQMVTQSLQISAGTAFARGRWLGDLEASTRWRAHDLVEKTKVTLAKANDTRKRLVDSDWSQLDANALETKFAEHGIIARQGAEARCTEAFEILAHKFTRPPNAEAPINNDQSSVE